MGTDSNAPLQVRLYGEGLGDYQTVNEWWTARHGHDLAETILPPLGIMVTQNGEPLGAVWCYECFGIGVCFLEFPITKPGLKMGEAKAVISMAIDGAVAVAKAHGDFSIFRCHTIPAIARILPGMGFVRSHREEMHSFTLRRD